MLTARLRDIQPKYSVWHIDVDDPACCGPAVSKILEEVICDRDCAAGASWPIFWETLGGVVDFKERLTICLCKIFYVTLGSAAVARIEGANPVAVFERADRRLDRMEYDWAADLLGGDADFRKSVRHGMLYHCMAVVDRPEVWSAIEATAAEIEGATMEVCGGDLAKVALPYLRKVPSLLDNPLPLTVWTYVRKVGTADWHCH